jgi:chitodextrinase
VTAGATRDGALVMAYVPQSQTITVNMTKLAGQVTAQWFDPSNGTYRPIAGSPFPNTGSRPFTHPGANSSGDVDWVLVLEASLVPDTQPPSVPTNLTAIAMASNRINLSWTASTDDRGVTGYQIYRDGVQIATSPTNSFSNTGLNQQTTYSYTVAGFDAAGNSSAQSLAASATTPALDTAPPSVPTGLVSSNVTANSLTLSWTASTDNVAVSGYQIFRNGLSIGSTSTTSYTDTGLVASTTYSYTVAASDTSGNVSAQSQPLTATTLSTPAAPIAFVQRNSAVPQSPQSTVTVAYTSAQTAGDTNILAIGWSGTAATITSVTDSKGNAYQAAIPATSGSAHYQGIYYARNIVQAATGANTVTVRFSAAVNYPDIRILEYSGLDPVNPFDVGTSSSGTGTAANSGAVTTTSASELIFGAGETAGAFASAGSGFVSRVITSPDGDIAEDKIVAATGSYSATANLSGSTGWLMQVATFRAPSSGTAMAMTASAVSPSPDAPAASVEVLDIASTSPRGSFDAPPTVPVAGALPLTGWALDDVGVNRVEIWRNCIDVIDRPVGVCAAAEPGGAADFVFVGKGVFLAGSRPEIEAASSGLPQAYRAGWGYALLTNELPHVPRGLRSGGQGTFMMSAYAVDDDNRHTLLGQRPIAVDNDAHQLWMGTDTKRQVHRCVDDRVVPGVRRRGAAHAHPRRRERQLVPGTHSLGRRRRFSGAV